MLLEERFPNVNRSLTIRIYARVESSSPDSFSALGFIAGITIVRLL